MPIRYIHAALFFFLITAISGVFMRLFPFWGNPPIAYDHILHAHSHLAILGWAFLGVFVIFLAIEWKKITRKKQAIAISFTLFLVTFVMFIAFLWTGYDVLSIIFSTLHIFVEYWSAIFIYKHIKNRAHFPHYISLYFKGAIIALLLSSIGPFSLGAISANGLKEFAIFDMAIYFYLHFQYNGWLTLFLVGLFLVILHRTSIPVKESFISLGFWCYMIALFPGYLLSVLWVENLHYFTHILGIVGSIGQWIGIGFILLGLKPSIIGLKKKFSKLIMIGLGITFLLLFIKSTFELGLISPRLSELIYETRSVIIGYLHLTLLGFVSIFIIMQFFMIGVLKPNTWSVVGLTVFLVGFVLNEVLLFIQSLLTWLSLNAISFYLEGLLLASIFLTVGVLLLWFSLFTRN